MTVLLLHWLQIVVIDVGTGILSVLYYIFGGLFLVDTDLFSSMLLREDFCKLSSLLIEDEFYRLVVSIYYCEFFLTSCSC